MPLLTLMIILFALAVVAECDNNLEEKYATKVLQPYLAAAKDAAYFIGLVKKQSKMGPSYQVDLSQLPVDSIKAFLKDLEPHVQAVQKLSTAVDEVSNYGMEVVHSIQSKIADLDEKADKLEKDLVRAESELKGNQSLLKEHQAALTATTDEYRKATEELEHAKDEAERESEKCISGKRKRSDISDKIKKWFERIGKKIKEFGRGVESGLCEKWTIISSSIDGQLSNIRGKMAVMKQKTSEVEELVKKVEALHTTKVATISEIAKIKNEKNATAEESEKVNKRLDSVHKVHATVKTHQKEINELAIKLDAMKDNGKLELLRAGLNAVVEAIRDVGDEVISTTDEEQKKELRDNLENMKISFL